MRIPFKNTLSFFSKNKITGMINRQYLTSSQAAEFMGKNPDWLKRKRSEGTGPVFRYIGKSPVYEVQDIINWVEKIPKTVFTKKTYYYFTSK